MKDVCKNHQILGTVIINSKGQIVIPIEVRKKMNLKTGDQLMLIAKGDIALGLVKTSNIEEVVKMLQQEIKETK